MVRRGRDIENSGDWAAGARITKRNVLRFVVDVPYFGAIPADSDSW
jgi:hypothetical protein